MSTTLRYLMQDEDCPLLVVKSSDAQGPFGTELKGLEHL